MSSFLAPLHGESVLAWYEKKHKKWGLFGGKAEPADQEDSCRTAIREFQEEWKQATGIALDKQFVKDLHSLGRQIIIPNKGGTVHTMSATPWMVKAEKVHSALRWVSSASEDQRFPLRHICAELGGSSPRGRKRAVEDDEPRPQAKQCRRNFTETVSELHARYILSRAPCTPACQTPPATTFR